jgi:hypothetical protein
VIELGPQVTNEAGWIARMRCHQSWWRAERLHVPWGVGPTAAGRPLGSYLQPADGEAGKNFLTDEIFGVVNARLGSGVERYRCLHNLLSSQPMCFNLFGPLTADLGLATPLLQVLLGSEVDEVTWGEIEWAPVPAADYLDDRTSFDAWFKYRRPDGSLSFLGIETKLTEPFSQKNPPEKTAKYQQIADTCPGVWKAGALEAPHPGWYQLWRNHLLAEALRRHPDGTYAAGQVAVVGHPLDRSLATAIDAYRAVLVKPETLLDLRLDKTLAAWTPVVAGTAREQWLTDFRDRYVDLSLSEGCCTP